MGGRGGIEKRCSCRSKAQREHCRCAPGQFRWRAYYYHHGKRISKTFAFEAMANSWLIDQLHSASVGRHIDPSGERVLFSEWVAEWQPTREAVLKRSTYLAEKGRLDKHLTPHFGNMTLAQITPLRVRQWVAKLTTQPTTTSHSRRVPKPLAPKTVRHCHALLHLIMADAIAEGIIGKNPCVQTRLPEIVQQEMVFLTEQQLEQLYDTVGDYWRPLVVTLALTGMRWGEAAGLKVGRVDLLAGYLRVEETLQEPQGEPPVFGTPKTRAARRRIRISRHVVDELLPLVAGKRADEPVFLTRHGHLVRNRTFRNNVWLPAMEKLGWSPRPRIHDLRHTHVAHLIADGVPLPAIQRRLGHKTISVTSDVYGHLLPSVDDAMIAAMDLRYTSWSPRRPTNETPSDSTAGQSG